MVKFVFNNTKNASIGYIPYKLNNSYYSYILCENNIDPCSKFYLVDKLASELKNQMLIYQQNLFNTQEL